MTPTIHQHTSLPKTRNVFRIDTDTQAGWQVRIQRGGQLYSRSFADTAYGSTEDAYEAAVTWRDERIDELGEADLSAEHLQEPRVRERAWKTQTRMGVKGLGFTVKKISSRSDERAPYVTVHWKEQDGFPGYASYSVRMYGAEAALKMACNRLWAERRRLGEEVSAEEDLFEAAWPNIQQLVSSDE